MSANLKVQFRESDEKVTRYVEERGLNANEIARDVFERHIRALISEERRDRLARRKIRLPTDAGVAWAREERET